MKKILTFILALIMSVMVLSGCSDEKNMQEFYITDIPLGDYSADFSSLIEETKSEESYDYAAVKEMLIKKYTGTQNTIGNIDKTLTGTFYGIDSFDDNLIRYENEAYYYSVSADNGKLTRYEIKLDINEIINSDSIQRTPVITLEEGKNIAEEFLSSFVDLSEYTYERGYESFDNYYSYSYGRFIDGIETTEGLHVDIKNWTGEVSSYQGNNVGKFSNVRLPDGFDLADTNSRAVDYFDKTVKEKIGNVVENLTSSVEDCVLEMRNDGKLYLSNKITCCVDGDEVAFEVCSYIKQ